MKKYIYLFIIFSCFNALNTNAFAESKLSNVVKPIHYFTDRDEHYKKLQDYFASGGDTIFITGISGIGKTELARTYALREEEHYDLIWYFDCNNTLPQQYLYLARMINSTVGDNAKKLVSEDIEDIQKNVIDFLNTGYKKSGFQKKWLLIFDNINIANIDRVNTIVPSSHNGHIIACSQGRNDSVQMINMSGFTHDNSIKLINKVYPEIKEQDAVKLVEKASAHPFLLVKGAMFLSNNSYLTIDEYKTIMSKTDIINDIRNYMQMVRNKLSKEDNNLLLKLALIDHKNLSKSLLSKLYKIDKEQINARLYPLVKYSLIDGRQGKDETRFEMHDIVKDDLLNHYSKKEIQKNIDELLAMINESFVKKDMNTRKWIRTYFEQEPSLYNNIIALLKNAEIYSADALSTMELHKNIMLYYRLQYNFSGWREQANWLDKQEEQGIIKLSELNSHYKAVYAWYELYRGCYYDFMRIDNPDAYNKINKAKNIADQLPKEHELKFMIYAELSQREIFRGDIINAKKHILQAHKITKEQQKDYGSGLLWFIDAKISLEEGNYKEALVSIDKATVYNQNVGHDKITLTNNMLKSEILVRAEMFKEAYELASSSFELSKKYYIYPHDRQGRILNYLAGAEVNLGKLNEAEEHIKLAKNIFLRNKLPHGPEAIAKELESSIDDDLANILIVEADLMLAKNCYKESIKLYRQAENIYRRRFRMNIDNDTISMLYFKAAKAAASNKDIYTYREYLTAHKNIFGIDHVRMDELYRIGLN